MNKQNVFLLIIILAFISLNSFLFITAPEPLNEDIFEKKYAFSVNHGFNIVASLNDEYRQCYTKEIVGKGKKTGLHFDENWLNQEVEAGPLPALFLRSTSAFLEKSPLPLGLYLGSDFPISESNLLTGIQAEKFSAIKEDHQPKYFFDTETERYVAMFPDFASANACVSCHNNHATSPKKDWKLNDIMGATTWTFPNDSITTEELINWVTVYIQSANLTYSSYLDKTKTFEQAKAPSIGKKWPGEGYFLPRADTFSDTILSKTSLDLIKNFIYESK